MAAEECEQRCCKADGEARLPKPQSRGGRQVLTEVHGIGLGRGPRRAAFPLSEHPEHFKTPEAALQTSR